MGIKYKNKYYGNSDEVADLLGTTPAHARQIVEANGLASKTGEELGLLSGTRDSKRSYWLMEPVNVIQRVRKHNDVQVLAHMQAEEAKAQEIPIIDFE